MILYREENIDTVDNWLIIFLVLRSYLLVALLYVGNVKVKTGRECTFQISKSNCNFFKFSVVFEKITVEFRVLSFECEHCKLIAWVGEVKCNGVCSNLYWFNCNLCIDSNCLGSEGIQIVMYQKVLSWCLISTRLHAHESSSHTDVTQK